jgi:hypothetical protein
VHGACSLGSLGSAYVLIQSSQEHGQHPDRDREDDLQVLIQQLLVLPHNDLSGKSGVFELANNFFDTVEV